MSDVRPTKGVRPIPALAAQVASVPYDVVNRQEGRELAKGNALSFLHVEKPEIDLPDDVESDCEETHRRGAENLARLMRDGVMIRDASDCFYVYQLRMGKHVQCGVMLGASVDEYEAGLIKKHELTRKNKEDERTHHVDTVGANTGPVMLTYKSSGELNRLIDRIRTSRAADYDFVASDGVAHTMWVVSDPREVEGIRSGFARVDAMYVADGHHRAAAACRVRALRRSRNPKHTGREGYNYFLATAFPDDQLQIMGYHRVVKDLRGMSADQFLTALRGKFRVVPTSTPEPERAHVISMFLDGKWYSLEALSGTFAEDDPVLSLDCSILQENVLRPLLGIDDPRSSDRIDFIGGIRGTREVERRCREDMRVGFALFPVTVGALMAIADAGGVMPPKSTWFEPKLRSGMVVRMLDE